jgi:hypothetical protein
MGRDRVGRVVDPDNSKSLLLLGNKDVDTWMCILEAGICAVDAIKDLSNSRPGWAPDQRDGGSKRYTGSSDKSSRDEILKIFLQSGYQFISQYPDKQVRLRSTTGGTNPLSSDTTSIRTKAKELFEKIISFVLRTLPIFPVMFPDKPGFMWFGRSSPWEQKLAQDIDVLGAAENPRFRSKAAPGEKLKSG